ncbi:MAG TPA: type Z 30S ribosomal protein S14 [bacterium]|jgi:small subunit ribosomal protein S14|nr:type Z 30S ribosomal protein S14 [bacterium]
MARTAIVDKNNKAWKKAEHRKKLGLPVKFKTRLYHRCSACGRVHGYIGKFDMCRICIREKANAGELMGVRKASW